MDLEEGEKQIDWVVPGAACGERNRPTIEGRQNREQIKFQFSEIIYSICRYEFKKERRHTKHESNDPKICQNAVERN